MTEKEFMQDLFNRAVTHVVQQGRPAIGRSETLLPYHCRYRQPVEEGKVLMCAVGCLIPDSVYFPELEGVAVDGGADTLNVLRMAFPEAAAENWIEDGTATMRLLKLLQKAHDETGLSCTASEDHPTFVAEFKERAKGIAHLFDLTMPTFEGEKQ